MRLLLLLLLAGCSTCQRYGVDASEGAPIAGRIVAEHKGSVKEVMAKCQSPFQVRYGCSIAVEPGAYVIWYSDGASLQHERCHSLHEVGH